MGNENPAYFLLSTAGRCVRISSTNQAGAQGVVNLYERNAKSIFRELQSAASRPGSYLQWLDEPYPADNEATLLRVDDLEEEDYGQLRLALSGHPSDGELQLGAPDQEQKQLQEFLGLETQVMQLLHACRPDEAARQAAADRARALLSRSTDRTFFPTDGYCFRCTEDVTETTSDVSGMTGCPVCNVSWCD
jgi:hypothetical protein